MHLQYYAPSTVSLLSQITLSFLNPYLGSITTENDYLFWGAGYPFILPLVTGDWEGSYGRGGGYRESALWSSRQEKNYDPNIAWARMVWPPYDVTEGRKTQALEMHWLCLL